MDFLCNECAKSFAKEVDLVVHQLRAHDKRPFSCPVCKENFIGKDTQKNFRRHIKTVHKDNLEERNVTVSVNIAHIDPEDVAVGDLIVVPLDPSSLDPLTND